MITILYNKNDFEAASIALKVQSLAQGATSKIYIVPKHYGRNSSFVFANLSKTKMAIFIAHDTNSFDPETIRELEFLKNRNINIQLVVPVSFSHLRFTSGYNKIGINEYHKSNKNKTIGDISNFISNLSSSRRSVTTLNKSRSNGDLVAATSILVGLAILLLALSASSTQK